MDGKPNRRVMEVIAGFRLTLEQKAMLDQLADSQGKKFSEFIRDLALQEIGRMRKV